MSGFRYRPFRTQPRRLSRMMLGRGFVTNVPPLIVVPGAQSATSNIAKAITGTSLSDADGNTQTVTLTTNHSGTVSLASLTGLTGSGDGTNSLSYSGTIAALNTALATLTYTSATDYAGSETISISTNDGAGGTDSESIAITVTWTPDSVASLALWFNPDPAAGCIWSDAGTTIAQVGDPVYRWKASNSATYLQQTTLANRPILRQGANGKYYLEFDGSNDYLNVTGLTPIDFANFFIAANLKLDVIGNNRFAWGHSGAYTGSGFYAIIDLYYSTPTDFLNSRFSDNDQSPLSTASYSAAANTSWQRASHQFDGTTNTLYENNVSKATNTPAALSTANITRICIGSGATGVTSQNCDCNIGHYVMCTDDLSSGNRALIETYLAAQEPT